MIQQLKFSPVENVLTVLFVVAILGYLVYLLDLSLQNKQRGKHTVSRATVVSKGSLQWWGSRCTWQAAR